MKVSQLKEVVNSLPEALDDHGVVFSEVEIIDKEKGTWARKDVPLESSVIDSDHEELILAKSETVDKMFELSGQSEDDESEEE